MNTFGAKRYGGWENTLIGGHSIGHYLTALSQAYQNPNISDEERGALMNKMKALVDGMKECQKNSKGQPGFVWAATKGNQQNVEFQFDNVENRKTNIIQEAWVPWYTMHKLIAGLVDVYKNTGYEPAKEVASGLGDWTYNRCSKWSSQTHATVLSIEYGGMNDCLYDLYSVTQNQKYADAAHFFDETALFDRVLSGGTDVLNGKHANTTIPKFMGALKRYMVLGGKDEKYLEYAKSFWDMVTTHHTYVTGGNSEWEHFGKDDILDAERTNCNCETCNSYNMLKLSRELFKVTDTVQPGYGQYENDDLHNMQEYLSKSVTSDSTYRYTSGNGYFGYQMAVDEAAQYSVLTVKFRKEDNGKTIKVRVGDKVLYNEKLSYEGNKEVYDVRLIVPPEVISSCVKNVEANGTTYSAVDVFFSSADGRECAKVCDFIYMTAVKPLYESDSSIAYFVDCGDHDTSTVTGTDKLGYYNSRTEQVYGEDEVTGAVWGIIDDTADQYNGSSKSKGIYTANTWANEQNTADNQSKENSNRYTKNQYENNIARHLDYGFTLPDGSYNVEIGFCNPWKCSNNPSVYANFGTDSQSTVAENVPINGNTSIKGKVNVTDGRLTLNFRSEDKAINLSYIIIRFDEKASLPSGGIKGNLNSDGKVNSADAVIMQKYMLSDEGVFDGYSADMDNSCSLGITDMILVKNKIIG